MSKSESNVHFDPAVFRSFGVTVAQKDLPEQFPHPEYDGVHEIAKQAAAELLKHLPTQPWYPKLLEPEGGKMFGVLVVQNTDQLGYIAAFSGMLGGNWLQPGFVPPVFDVTQYRKAQLVWERHLSDYTARIQKLRSGEEHSDLLKRLDLVEQQAEQALKDQQLQRQSRKAARKLRREEPNVDTDQLDKESAQDKQTWKHIKQHWEQEVSKAKKELSVIDSQIRDLKHARAAYSLQQQREIFNLYWLKQSASSSMPINTLFAPELPPGGAGDCAAPKLLQHAHTRDWKPIALAEFWVGRSPTSGIRRHGLFYPPCRSKCHTILPYMLKNLYSGYHVDGIENRFMHPSVEDGITLIYEDEWLAVVNKPNGLLSTPGKFLKDSVQTRFLSLYPESSGPLLVHRLDMDTSGVMLVAKNKAIHKQLQRQFILRTVDKHYVALVEQGLCRRSGTIELPLRVDLDDRPRQLVCHQFGKPAKTHFKVLESNEKHTRVSFTPVTGRTHQIRVHAAHQDGLNSPIVGDRLYGSCARRMMLHAESISFKNPVTHLKVTFSASPPF